MSFETKIFKDFSGNEYSFHDFKNLYLDYSMKGYKTYIGSDSQIIKGVVSMVTSICLHKQSLEYGGGKIFYVKDKFDISECKNLKSRMFKEAYRSLEMAMLLDEMSNEIEVHLDVGQNIKNKTSDFYNELQSLITSQGYTCEIKPNSWASSAVADRMSKD